MKVLESNEKEQINIFLDKLTSDKEISKLNNKSEISDFNLEYQKYKTPPDNHAKFNEEFQKLVDFVKESNLYRDIYGNKITKKGKLLLTPFQRIRKLNDEIKAYYENKNNKKTSQLIIKNYKSKYKSKNEYTDFNLSIGRKKILPMKKYNTIKLKYDKMKEFKEKHYLTMNKLNLEINPSKELKSIIKKKFRAKTMNFKNNFLCLSNTSSNSRNKYFNVEKFNQINYWKTRILKMNEIFKKIGIDKELSIISKYKKYIASRNNILENKNETDKNNDKINSLRKTINIKKLNRNKMLIESKTIDENLDKYKYKLIQFNLSRLIKPSLKYKDKEVLNTKDLLTPIKKNNEIKKDENKIDNKMKKNKIIGVNMDLSVYNANN